MRETILEIGYDSSKKGFDGASCGVSVSIGAQSPDIAQGVDDAYEERVEGDERPARPPGRRRPGPDVRLRLRRDPRADAAADRARAPARRAGSPRSARTAPIPYLRPDGKTQVTIEYDGDSAGPPRHRRRLQPARRRHRPRARCSTPDIARARRRARARRPRHRHRRLPAAGQPDRPVRDRRPDGRRRPHRPQDHRRHLRRHGPPRRRRVLRQGPVQGRPLGRVRDALGRQERRRRRPGRALRGPGRLRDRQGRTRSACSSRPSAPRRSPDEQIQEADRRGLRPAPGRDHPRPRPAAPDLRADRGLRPLRPRAARLHLGAHRPRRRPARPPPAPDAASPTPRRTGASRRPSVAGRSARATSSDASRSSRAASLRSSAARAAVRTRAAARRAARRAARSPGSRSTSPLAHLDRPFDYAVPGDAGRRGAARAPGCGCASPAGSSTASSLERRGRHRARRARWPRSQRVVSPEPVLDARGRSRLARAVADRYAGTLADVLRLAVPPRHARVEAERRPPAPPAAGAAGRGREPGGWAALPSRAGVPATRCARARPPRAVWTALPGAGLAATRLAAAGGRRDAGRRPRRAGRVPDARDVDAGRRRARPPCSAPAGTSRSPPTSGRPSATGAGCAVRRGAGPRRASAPGPRCSRRSRDLGLVVVWDDGDDLHAEPRAPYPHVREVLALRAAPDGRGAAASAGYARTAEARSCWSRPAGRTPLAADRERGAGRARRGCAPSATTPSWRATRPPARARLPTSPGVRRGEALRAGPGAGPGAAPRLPAGAGLRRAAATPARCAALRGARSALTSAHAVAALPLVRPARPATGRCPDCGGTPAAGRRSSAPRRTAEELGRAFPGRAGAHLRPRRRARPRSPAEPALVVATPGAEPVAEGGYARGAAARRLGAAGPARPAGGRGGAAPLAGRGRAGPAGRATGGTVVVVGRRRRCAPVQALVRWDPVGYADARARRARASCGFPPAARMAALDRAAAAPSPSCSTPPTLPAGAEVLGPVPVEPPRTRGPARPPTRGARRWSRVPRGGTGAALGRARCTARAGACRSARKARRRRCGCGVDPRRPRLSRRP